MISLRPNATNGLILLYVVVSISFLRSRVIAKLNTDNNICRSISILFCYFQKFFTFCQNNRNQFTQVRQNTHTLLITNKLSIKVTRMKNSNQMWCHHHYL